MNGIKRSMAVASDYPEYDLVLFYDAIATQGDHIETRWAKKAGKIWCGIRERKFWVQRKKK